MGHSRTPTQNTAGDGFPADPIDGYVRASIRASPDKSPTRRLVIEATYDLEGHRPSMQCAACTIDLTTAGKGYAATGRQTPRPRPRPGTGTGTGTGITTHPARQRRGPTPGRKNWRRYALITAARKPRVTRALLPAPRALMQAAGPEESRRPMRAVQSMRRCTQ